MARVAVGIVISSAIVSGLAAGVTGVVGAGTAAAAALACASIVIVVAPQVRRALVVAALCLAAAAHGGARRDRVLHAPLRTVGASQPLDAREAVPVLVVGVLAEDASASDAGVRLVIDVSRVRLAGGWVAMRGRLQAHVAGDLAQASLSAWTAGRAITAPVVLRAPQILLNPGSPGETWQALRRPFDVSGTIKSGALVEVTPARWWHEVPAAVRRHVREVAARAVSPHALQSGAIVTAILIGDRTGLSDGVARRLQAAGTYHVLAISGGNVALLTAMCFLGLRALVRSHRAVSVATIVFVAGYGWTVGGDPSVLRAVIAACLYLLSGLVGLSISASALLALVAVIVGLADPLMVIDVGAWLSFGATLGIILVAGPLIQRLTPASWSEMPAARRAVRWRRACARAAISLLAATVAAELALLPISATVFGRVGGAGLVLNFIAIPAMAIVQIGGLAASFLSWCEPAASAAGAAAALAAAALVESARLVEIVPWLTWRVPPVSIAWTVAFYAAGVMALWLRGSSWLRIAATGLAALSAGVLAFAPFEASSPPPNGWLRVTVIDVGQGDAVLAQLPTGHALLVDAGGTARRSDIGSRIVSPAVWALGARRLDWLAVTHADLDHIGGAASVATDLSPREIWESIAATGSTERRELRLLADRETVIWRRLLAGHAFESAGLQVDVLHPPAPDWERQRVRNDDSLVLRLRFGDVEVLLTGDAGEEFERRFLATSPPAAIRILKVGHHGSRTSSSERFLRAFQPHAALVSVGRGNLFGHPAPDVLRRLHALDAAVFRTDRDGAIVVETDGRVARVRTMRGREWTIRAYSS
jgi:competence protein ComEC